MSRSRTRKKHFEYPLEKTSCRVCDAYHPEYGDPIAQASPAATMVKKHLELSDVVGAKQCDFNPCQHTKFLCAGFTPVHTPTEYSESGDYWTRAAFAGNNGLTPLNLPDALAANFSIPGIGNWLEDFSARAERHFKTAVDVNALIVNFLLEAIEAIEGNVEALKSLAQAIETAVKNFRRMFAQTGNYWLSWNFAIKPTISDIKAIFGSFKAAEGRLKWLKKHNHRPVKIYYREGPRYYTPTVESGVYWPLCSESGIDPITGEPFNRVAWASGNWRTFTDFDFCEVRLSSYAWVTFDIPDYLLDDSFSTAAVWAAMMGLYNPLSIVWEAVPFSWLIDWFLDQKTRLLIYMADLSPFPDAVIQGSAWSCKMKSMGSVSINCISGHPRESYDVGKVLYQTYVRQPGLPSNDDGSPFRLPLEWYNGSIIAALIQQHRRR